MNAAGIAAALKGKRAGSGCWMARCPAHQDRKPSLSIGSGRRGKVLVDLARLPLDRHTATCVARGNDPARLRRETAWGRAGQPKPIFGPDALPLNVAGGHQFPGAAHVADVIPRSRAARTRTVDAKADGDALDIPASLVRRPAP
jgi:hypothetical protein